MNRVTVWVSLRYGFSPENKHRGTSITILVGIVICMTSMVLVLSFMNLLSNGRMDQIRRYESYDLSIPSVSLLEADALLAKVRECPSVGEAFLYADSPVLVDGDMMTARFLEEGSAAMGKFAQLGGGEGLRLPSLLYRGNIDVEIVSLKKGKQARVVPKSKMVPVSGYFWSGDYQIDGSYVLMSFSSAKEYVNECRIGIYADGNVEKVKQELENATTHRVETYKESNASLYSALHLEHVVMRLVFVLLLLLVVFSVRRSTKRLVECKRQEIGMLRAMGLDFRDVQRVFLFQSGYVSLLGVLVALAISSLLIHFSPSLFSLLSQHFYLFQKGDALAFPLGEALGVSLFVITGTFACTYWGLRRYRTRSLMELLRDE